MRVSSQSALDTSIKAVQSTSVEKIEKQENLDTTTASIQQGLSFEKNGVTHEKLQQAVSSLNEILEINHNSSKFVYHEGLDRYYVQVVNKEKEEVVKEIPSEKLLDAFYEMQKLVGMIVDEKI